MMAHMEMHLITSTQAAKRLGVTRNTVSQWAKQGKLEYVYKVSGATGAFLYDAAYIDALAKEKAGDDAL